MKMKKAGKTNGRVWVMICVALLTAMVLFSCRELSSDSTEYEEASLTLSYRGVDIGVGGDADALVSSLGSDYTVMEAESCAGIGTDYVYTYPSLRLYVFRPEKGTAVVTSVCYTDDGAQTKGVTIGSLAQEVLNAFGEPQEQSENMIRYRSVDVVLTFSLRDGAVTAVVLAEDED